MLEWIKKVYIYIFSAVGLVLVISGSVSLINLGLKAWVFTKADVYSEYPRVKPIPVEQENGETKTQEPDAEELAEYRKNDLASRQQRQASNAIAMIIVGAPLFLYHWKLAKEFKG